METFTARTSMFVCYDVQSIKRLSASHTFQIQRLVSFNVFIPVIKFHLRRWSDGDDEKATAVIASDT